MAVDESAKTRPLLFWEAFDEEHNAAKGAGFAGNRELGPIKIIPDLHGHEADQQTKDDTKWGQHPRQERLKARPRASTASPVTAR